MCPKEPSVGDANRNDKQVAKMSCKVIQTILNNVFFNHIFQPNGITLKIWTCFSKEYPLTTYMYIIGPMHGVYEYIHVAFFKLWIPRNHEHNSNSLTLITSIIFTRRMASPACYLERFLSWCTYHIWHSYALCLFKIFFQIIDPLATVLFIFCLVFPFCVSPMQSVAVRGRLHSVSG